MKQTIEIEVPDGKKAVWKDGKVVFEDIKPQLPKTWEEFCEMKKPDKSEAFISNGSRCVELGVFGDPRERRLCQRDRNFLPSKKAAEQHLALMQLHQLRDYYRQGWVPDWSDTKNKYCITHIDNNYSITANMGVIAFLSFQSKELAKEFLNNFEDLIKQAGDLI